MLLKLGLRVDKSYSNIYQLPIKKVTDKNGHIKTVHYNPDKDKKDIKINPKLKELEENISLLKEKIKAFEEKSSAAQNATEKTRWEDEAWKVKNAMWNIQAKIKVATLPKSKPKPESKKTEKIKTKKMFPNLPDTRGYKFSPDKYYRRARNTDMHNNDAAYYMFVQGKDPGSYSPENKGYGGHLFEYEGKNSMHIYDLKEKLVKTWNEDKENGKFGYYMDSFNADHYENIDLDDDAILKLFNPDRIVDTAAGFDEPALVSWLYDRVLEPNGIEAVVTNEGAVIFDNKLGKLVASDVEVENNKPLKKSIGRIKRLGISIKCKNQILKTLGAL